jgi:hypothetical protein
MIAALRQDFRHEIFFTQSRVVHMRNVYPVSFGNHLCIVTNFVAQRIGKLFGVIEYLDLVSIDSMFKFLNFLHYDTWKIIQQLGTVAKPSVLCGLNLSQPYACQKALTEKHRQQAQPIP